MTAQNLIQRSTPEQQGISSAAILEFVNAVEANIQELHSFMLLRHGQVVAEGWWAPYGPERPHMLFSLSKSFTSTAIGLAVAEGRLSVDDRVVSFFPEDVPAKIGKNLADMRVRHLLSMTTGHIRDATGAAMTQKEGNWAKGFLALPVRHTPGTHFVYNTAATYMLSAIIQKLTGTTLLDYLTPRLFEPLGIENPTWETCPRGINTGGFGLNIKTEDIAHFGQLYLQKGVWNGRQILPEAWVAEATSSHISNGTDPNSDWAQGYGYQFWRCRHDNYRGDGAFGQYCIVMPAQDAVLAITSGLKDMQPPLNIVWEQLLPAMQPVLLVADPVVYKQLEHKLTSLVLPPPSGQSSSYQAERLSGKSFSIGPNRLGIKTIAFQFFADHCTLNTQNGKDEIRVECGYGVWRDSKAPMLDRGLQPVKASGVWTAEDTFVITLRFVETPFVQTMTCKFGRSRLSITSTVNVSFGPTRLPALHGKLT